MVMVSAANSAQHGFYAEAHRKHLSFLPMRAGHGTLSGGTGIVCFVQCYVNIVDANLISRAVEKTTLISLAVRLRFLRSKLTFEVSKNEYQIIGTFVGAVGRH